MTRLLNNSSKKSLFFKKNHSVKKKILQKIDERDSTIQYVLFELYKDFKTRLITSVLD